MPKRPRPTPPTLVLLVRHGLTATTGKVLPGRAPGLALADRGREQADAVAERIAALARAPVAVYASPLERTRQTAAPIAKGLGLRVRADKGLLEADVGDWEGRELAALRKDPQWSVVQRYPSGFSFPGGESLLAMQARVEGAVQRLAAGHRGETIVAVSHADPIKAAVASAMGVHLDFFQRFVISPCSVTGILYGPLGPTVLAVNAVGALSELALS